MVDSERLFRSLRNIKEICEKAECDRDMCPLYGTCKSFFSKNPCDWEFSDIEERWLENE